jgi:NitT/TauT family transport system ATP-binding protein
MLRTSASEAGDGMDGTRPFIAVSGLSKHYLSSDAPIIALDGIDFSIREGEFISIVGPSGCGKSTLLKILAGLEACSKGTATLRGSPIGRPRRDIGVVFQSPVLFPWRSIIENVLLPIDVLGLSRKEGLKTASDLLDLVGLNGFEHRYPRELSGGMQQRVGIARALAHDPALLLMDEPFGALDAMTRENLNLELQRLWIGRRKTIIFITHSIAEAIFLADRVFVMTPRPGRLMDMLDIDLPRPRKLDIINTPEFGRYAERIRVALSATGRLD